jgi:hypothetical protein
VLTKHGQQSYILQSLSLTPFALPDQNEKFDLNDPTNLNSCHYYIINNVISFLRIIRNETQFCPLKHLFLQEFSVVIRKSICKVLHLYQKEVFHPFQPEKLVDLEGVSIGVGFTKTFIRVNVFTTQGVKIIPH